MVTFTIPNRPFATEPITGLMLPDGIFAAAVGKQNINASVKNTGTAVTNVQVYVESVSDPGIVVTPTTHFLSNAATGASHLFAWEADLTAAASGKHLVSFIVETPAGQTRIIKKIFVVKIGYDPATGEFSGAVPEGVLKVGLETMLGPASGKHCCRPRKQNACGCHRIEPNPSTARQTLPTSTRPSNDQTGRVGNTNVLDYLVEHFQGYDPDFVFCMPGYLLENLQALVTPTPPYQGPYGDLPFQDPWWKILLAILALLLLIAAAIAEAVDGSGEITVTASGTHDLPSGSGGSCCDIGAEGGGTSYVAAGLLAAAAAVAVIAGASDIRDPFRTGQDHTAPTTASELTTQEALALTFAYPEPIVPGTPFKVSIDYTYQRLTTAGTYDYAASETNANLHALSKYEINAPDVVHAYKRELWVVQASFFDTDGKIFTGDQLFVQCFLVGPQGQYRRFVLQDNGLLSDAKVNDGIYTGAYRFNASADKGIWTYYVIAQDINDANPDMQPDEAAQIIGGMLLTGQLSITFSGGTCPLVPDGHVNVIA